MTEIWTMGEILVEIMRPHPNIPLSVVDRFRGPFPGGAPAIFIDAVSRLGHSGGIIGAVGDDDFGRSTVARLVADGVRTDHVASMPGLSTAVDFVAYLGDGSRHNIFHIDGTPAVKPAAVTPESVGETKMFHIMGCSLMPNGEFRDAIIETAKRLHARGAKITFDPNILPELLQDQDAQELLDPILERTSVLLAGVKELAAITGRTTVEAAVGYLFDSTAIETIVLKLTNEGCSIYTASETISVPPFSVEEADPTGAGDCFDAGFLCGLLEGKSLTACGELAAAAGALNRIAFGPMEGDLRRSTVDRFLAERPR